MIAQRVEIAAITPQARAVDWLHADKADAPMSERDEMLDRFIRAAPVIGGNVIHLRMIERAAYDHERHAVFSQAQQIIIPFFWFRASPR